MKVGGIVLCGGKSSRMGHSKALLPFGPELMLPRVVRILGGVVSPIVVVAAPDQELPELPADVILARDDQPDKGPLQGLYSGLTALADQADAAYATSCDVPLLAPEFVRSMIDRLGDAEIAVPVEEKFQHTLAAVYRTRLRAAIGNLLHENILRPSRLFDLVATNRVAVDDLRAVDPELRTLANLNRPEDYFAALAQTGLEVPAELRAKLSR